jgi:hypothetical protein
VSPPRAAAKLLALARRERIEERAALIPTFSQREKEQW